MKPPPVRKSHSPPNGGGGVMSAMAKLAASTKLATPRTLITPRVVTNGRILRPPCPFSHERSRAHHCADAAPPTLLSDSTLGLASCSRAKRSVRDDIRLRISEIDAQKLLTRNVGDCRVSARRLGMVETCAQ